MSWKHDVGGWATNGRDPTLTRRTNANGSVLESALTNVTARASPSLHSSRPKSPLLNKSSPSRTPATEVTSRASPASSLSAQKAVVSNQKQNAFVPKGWVSSNANKVSTAPKTSKVIFADRIDDRSLNEVATTGISTNQANLTLPSLTARSRLSSNNSVISATSADPGNKSKWVTIFGGSSGEFQHVLHHLTSRCGPIRRVHWPAASPHCNWLHVQFVDTIGAAAAIDSPLHITLPAIGGSGVVMVRFAVSWCADAGLVEYYNALDAEEEEAQRLLSDPEQHEEEDNGKSGQGTLQNNTGTLVAADSSSSTAGALAEVRPVSALDRIAKLSESSKRFALGDVSSAFTHSSAAANRNFHNSFSSNAGGNDRRNLNGSQSFFRSSLISRKAEIRNGNVFVPIPSRKGLRTAAELWLPSDVPLVPSTINTLFSIVVSPIEWGARWWFSEEVPIAQSATSSSASFRFDDEPTSFFSFLWGDSYDDPPAPMTTKKTRSINFYRPIIAIEQEPLTNDVRTIIRPLPWYLDYGRLVSLVMLIALAGLVYYLVGGPFLEAFIEAVFGLVSFVFSTFGLLLGGGGGSAPDNFHATRAASPNAPRWEYLYESNFANENNRNDFYAF